MKKQEPLFQSSLSKLLIQVKALYAIKDYDKALALCEENEDLVIKENSVARSLAFLEVKLKVQEANKNISDEDKLKTLYKSEDLISNSDNISILTKLNILKQITSKLANSVNIFKTDNHDLDLGLVEQHLSYLKKQDAIYDSLDESFASNHCDLLRDLSDVYYFLSEINYDSEINIRENIKTNYKALKISEKIPNFKNDLKAIFYEELANSLLIINKIDEARENAKVAYELHEEHEYLKKARCKMLMIETDEKQKKYESYIENAFDLIDLIKKNNNKNETLLILDQFSDSVCNLDDKSKISRDVKKEILVKIKLIQDNFLSENTAVKNTTKQFIESGPTLHLKDKNQSISANRSSGLNETETPSAANINISYQKVSKDHWWVKKLTNDQRSKSL